MATIPTISVTTKEHEWTRLSGNAATVGITIFARTARDVVYLELPEVGSTVTKAAFGVVESTKAVSELFRALSGR